LQQRNFFKEHHEDPLAGTSKNGDGLGNSRAKIGGFAGGVKKIGAVVLLKASPRLDNMAPSLYNCGGSRGEAGLGPRLSKPPACFPREPA
jgi:hypothetical protein